MVEIRRCPARCAVTRGAIRGEVRRHVRRIGRAVVVTLVAGDTGRVETGKDAAGVTPGAGHVEVGAGQRESVRPWSKAKCWWRAR